MMSENFFSTFKSLSRTLDKSIKEIQNAVENDNKHEYCHTDVSKLIQEMRRNTKEVKSQARNVTSSLQECGMQFDSSLKTSMHLTQSLEQNLTEIEEYLHQYGYKLWVKPDSKTTVEEEMDAGESDGKSVEEAEANHTSPDNPSTATKGNRTPKLEDFSISDFTMRMISKLDSSKKTFAKPVARIPSASISTQIISSQSIVESRARGDSIPAIFNHDGLTVTPSLMNGRQIPLLTPDTERVGFVRDRGWIQDSAADSPCPPTFQTPGLTQITRHPTEAVELSQPNFNDQSSYDSPIPPVFQTPGIKQIPTKQDLTLIDSTQKAQLQQNGSCYTVYNDSPQCPVFRTPGMKQIQTDSKTDNQPIGSCYSAYNDSPVCPAFMTPGLKHLNSVKQDENNLEEPGNKQTAKTSLFLENRASNLQKQHQLGNSHKTEQYEEESHTQELTSKLDEMIELTKSFHTAYSMTSFKKEPIAPELLVDRLGKNQRTVETPPHPELLADRLRRGKTTSTMTPQPKLLSDQLQNTKTYSALHNASDSPQPPIFLGKYSFSQTVLK